MKYRVEYSKSFLDDIRHHVGYMRQEHVSEDTIDRWFGKLLNQVDALEQSPKRHPVDELQSEATGVSTRKMVFGDYLVFYTVGDADPRVEVDRFVHGARDRRQDLLRLAEQNRQKSAESDRDPGHEH